MARCVSAWLGGAARGGARLQNLTAFVPDPGRGFGALGGPRLGPFPIGVDPMMHDFMSNHATHWIVSSSRADVAGALRNLLGVAPSSVALAGAPPPSRARRIRCFGLLSTDIEQVTDRLDAALTGERHGYVRLLVIPFPSCSGWSSW